MDEEYRDFLLYLYRRSFGPQLMLWFPRRFRHRLHFDDDFGYSIESLTATMRALRFIDGYFPPDANLRDSFTDSMLRGLVESTASGVQLAYEMTGPTGIADVVQANFREIVTGLNVDGFLEADFEVMRGSGSTDPQLELRALIHHLKTRRDEIERMDDRVLFSRRLETMAGRIRQRFSLVRQPQPPTPQRPDQPDAEPVRARPFKAMGNIVQGAILTSVDVAAATGIWAAPVSEDARAIGAVMSVATGIGSILSGIGDLRGE